MKYEDKKNKNKQSVFSYYGEDSNELNDSFEKLMSENKKPIYTPNKKESIFTSQDSFEKNPNIKKFHVVAKQSDTSQDIQEFEKDEFDNSHSIQEVQEYAAQDFELSSYTQSSYINDFDIIDEPEETYDDIKNEIAKTTQEQLLDLDKYASSGFEPKNPHNTQFDVNTSYTKSYEQIPAYAPKASSSKSSKENQRNTLVYNIINKNTQQHFVQDVSSTSSKKANSTIQNIPVKDISNILPNQNNHGTQTQNPDNDLHSSKLKDENESMHKYNSKKIKAAPKVVNKNKATNSNVVEFTGGTVQKTNTPKNKTTSKSSNKKAKAPKEKLNNQPKPKNQPVKPKQSSQKTKPEKKSNDDKVAIVAKIIAIVFAGFIVFGLVFYLFIGVDVASINVSGESVYEQSEIIRACEIELTDNILQVSPNKLEQKLTTRLPYLSEVEVSKSLSDGISIQIIATTSDEVSIKSDDSYFTIDENNKVLSLDLSSEESTYIFVGFDYEEVSLGETYVASEENQARYEIMQQLIQQLDLCEINADFYVDITDIESVIIYYNDSLIQIRLGEVLYPENVVNSFSIISDYSQTASGYINAYSYDNLTVNISN